jgi:hypothetical protein
MTESEKMQQTIKRVSEAYRKLPEWVKAEKKEASAAVERTVRPVSRDAKKR